GDGGEVAAPCCAASARRLGRCGGPSGCAASRGTRGLVIIGFKRRTRAGLCGQGISAKPLLGDFVSFAAGFLVVLAALFFFTLAGVGRGARRAPRLFPRAPGPSPLSAPPPVLRVPHTPRP